jgi:hypothetical protein
MVLSPLGSLLLPLIATLIFPFFSPISHLNPDQANGYGIITCSCQKLCRNVTQTLVPETKHYILVRTQEAGNVLFPALTQLFPYTYTLHDFSLSSSNPSSSLPFRTDHSVAYEVCPLLFL